MAKLSETVQEAVIENNFEAICDALELGPNAKKKFEDLLAALAGTMDFPLKATGNILETLDEFKRKVDTEFVHAMNMTMEQILSFKVYLSQLEYYFGEAQSDAEARSTQLQYGRYLKEAGVMFTLSKHGRTLAERIAKGVTNPDKEAISKMVSTQEYAGEVRAYHLSVKLKNVLKSIKSMQGTLDSRYQQLYKEWAVEEQRKNQMPDGRRHNQFMQ